jgi:hypothetical protein
MAKYWTPTAKGRKTIKPDLYEGLRAFARQQKDIVAAAKEEDLRIQQRNEQWDRSQKETESNVLENRRQLQEAENEKFNTRAKAITNRRDTEVDRLRGEAKIAERRASDWQALTPKLAKSITDVATTGYQLADLHYGTKKYNEEDAKGITGKILATQIYANEKGITDGLNLGTDIKLKAYKNGDWEAFDFAQIRADINWAKDAELTMSDVREMLPALFNHFDRDTAESGFKVTKENILGLYGLRALEVSRGYGFDDDSKEAIEIRQSFKKHALNQKFKLVTKADEGKRKRLFDRDEKHFLHQPKGDVGEAKLNSWITNQLRVNWEFNPRTNEYDPKPVDAHLKLREATQTVGKRLAVADRYQNIGGRAGLQLFREEFYDRKLPAKEGETAEYHYKKFPEDWEIYEKAYLDEQKKRENNRKGIVESDSQALIAKVERLTNPDIPLLEGEERINPLDTSEGGGFEKLEKMYKLAPTPAAQSFIGSKMNYTVSKSNGYSLPLHKAIVEAGESGDPAGYVYLVDQIADPTIKKEKQAKYKFATVLLRGGENFESLNDWSESEVIQKLGGSPTIPGTNKFKQNYKDQTADLNQYLHWYISENIDRLDAPKSEKGFDGNVKDFIRSIKKDVSEEFQAGDSKRFPTIPAGGEDSVKGQKGLLFSRMLSGGNVEESPTTMTDYKAVLDKNWIDNSSPFGFYKGNPNQVIGDKIPNIEAVIKSGVLFTATERVNLATSIEEGGGMDNIIYIKPDVYELADMHPEWTARDIVNADLKAQGFKHRLPPDPYTFVKMSGYKGKKPKNRDVKSLLYYRNINTEFEDDPFKRKYLLPHEKPKDVASMNQSAYSYVNGQIISNIL